MIEKLCFESCPLLGELVDITLTGLDSNNRKVNCTLYSALAYCSHPLSETRLCQTYPIVTDAQDQDNLSPAKTIGDLKNLSRDSARSVPLEQSPPKTDYFKTPAGRAELYRLGHPVCD